VVAAVASAGAGGWAVVVAFASVAYDAVVVAVVAAAAAAAAFVDDTVVDAAVDVVGDAVAFGDARDSVALGCFLDWTLAPVDSLGILGVAEPPSLVDWEVVVVADFGFEMMAASETMEGYWGCCCCCLFLGTAHSMVSTWDDSTKNWKGTDYFQLRLLMLE